MLTIDNVGVDLLLNNGVLLDHTTHVGGGGLLDVLLNVVNNILVDLTMDDGLHLNDLVVSDGLLDDGRAEEEGEMMKGEKKEV